MSEEYPIVGLAAGEVLPIEVASEHRLLVEALTPESAEFEIHYNGKSVTGFLGREITPRGGFEKGTVYINNTSGGTLNGRVVISSDELNDRRVILSGKVSIAPPSSFDALSDVTVGTKTTGTTGLRTAALFASNTSRQSVLVHVPTQTTGGAALTDGVRIGSGAGPTKGTYTLGTTVTVPGTGACDAYNPNAGPVRITMSEVK